MTKFKGEFFDGLKEKEEAARILDCPFSEVNNTLFPN